MKLILFLVTTLVLSNSYGMGKPLFSRCSSQDINQESKQLMLDYLNSIAGYYEGETCRLHINVLSSQDSVGNFKAEVLLEDKNKEQFYVPIFFKDKRKTKKTYFCLRNEEEYIRYEYYDLNKTDQKGYKSKYYLEIKKNDETPFSKITVGVRQSPSKKMHWRACAFVIPGL